MVKLNNIAKTIKNNYGNYIAKGVGLAALGMVGYDSHKIGLYESDSYASIRDAHAGVYYLNNLGYLETPSRIANSVKQKAFAMEMTQTWRRFFNSGIGYIKGFTSMLVENVIPLGLGVATLLTKGKTSKILAGTLGIYGAGQFIKNFFGIGVPKHPLE